MVRGPLEEARGAAGGLGKGLRQAGKSSKSCVCLLLENQLLCLLVRASNSGLRGCSMPKYLIQASYQAAGAKGLTGYGGSKRRDAASKAINAAAGKVEAFHFASGEHDAYVVVDLLPDKVSAPAASLAINASGMVRTTTTILLTPEDIDAATKTTAPYRTPGQRADARTEPQSAGSELR